MKLFDYNLKNKRPSKRKNNSPGDNIFIFINKYISRIFKDIETIIDDANQYILIKVTFQEKTYTFKD